MYAALEQLANSRNRLFRLAPYIFEMVLELLDRVVAFALRARRYDEDEGLGLRTSVQEFVNETACGAKS